MKYVFTFGSEHLKGLGIRPMQQMLVIEADKESDARKLVFESFIGAHFAFSYTYEQALEFKEKYGIVEVTLEELEELHEKKRVTELKDFRAFICSSPDDIIDALGYALFADGDIAEKHKHIIDSAFMKYMEDKNE